MSYCIKIWGSIIIITTAAPKELSVHKSAYRIVHLQTNYALSNPPKNFRNCKRKFICRISRTNLIEKNLEPIVFLNQWAFWLEPSVATMKQWNHHFDAVIICMKMFCLSRILNSSSSNSSSNCLVENCWNQLVVGILAVCTKSLYFANACCVQIPNFLMRTFLQATLCRRFLSMYSCICLFDSCN